MRKATSKFIILVLLSFGLGAFTTILIKGPISKENVEHASNIIGIDLTASEIDSMLPGLEEFRADYQKNREKPLPNAISPAINFNPLPQDYTLPTTKTASGYSTALRRTVPASKDDLAYYSVRDLAYLLQNKLITSVELTEFFIARLKKYDPKLHCVVTLTEELALAQARKADQEISAGKYRGMLHGIPYGAKDLFATKKYKTTWGATPYKDQVLDYDATVIQKLEEAGAVLVAKLSMGALAWGDVWYKEMTRNPWDLESGSSGSSAGSAAAVSAGLVPFALGTETLGSIVSPSTVCGTTGLRPTFGRVSRYGAMALSWSMDKIGPICRSAEDCAIVLNAIVGPDGKDKSVIDVPFQYNSSLSLKTLKVGYVKSDFEKDYPFKNQDSQIIQICRMQKIELVPIELPELPDIGFILDAEAAAAFDELTLSGKDDQLVRQIKNAWPNVLRTARFIPAVEYIQANRKRSQLIEEMHKLFTEKGIDVFLHPSFASDALRITNLTGHPTIAIPTGLQENGKPASISITGKLFGEADLVRLAKTLQTQIPFHHKHPNLDGEQLKPRSSIIKKD